MRQRTSHAPVEAIVVEAKYWKTSDDGRLACELCPQACRIPEGGFGICQGRVNEGGRLYAANYGQCVSVAMDPIEKKPLYHYCPGMPVLSVACNGCNLRCDFCQNWQISQEPARTSALLPDDLVRLAVENGSFGIAYTYTEPMVWFEYLLDAGVRAHAAGLKNILVTNGVINEEPLRELLPIVDAMNVDLKSARDGFYEKNCHVRGGLEAAKRTIEVASGWEEDGHHVHLEITNLLITGENDSEDDVRELAEFIAGVDPAIPLHLSRYFPTYKMTNPPTSEGSLRRAYDIARERLHYVYVGNVGREFAADTVCPDCGHALIKRSGYATKVTGVSDGSCANCGRTTDVDWPDS